MTKTSSTVVTREVRTYRIARASRDIRTTRIERSSRFVRVPRVIHHLVKLPSKHLASIN